MREGSRAAGVLVRLNIGGKNMSMDTGNLEALAVVVEDGSVHGEDGSLDLKLEIFILDTVLISTDSIHGDLDVGHLESGDDCPNNLDLFADDMTESNFSDFQSPDRKRMRGKEKGAAGSLAKKGTFNKNYDLTRKF